MPTALFIGGYADGRWIDVPDRVESWQVQEFSQAPFLSEVNTPPDAREIDVRSHHYKVDSLHCKTDSWRVFVPLNFEPQDWISILLRGYRPATRTTTAHETTNG